MVNNLKDSTMKKREFKEDEQKDILQMYLEGKSTYEIAKKYSYYAKSVRNFLTEKGIKTQSMQEFANKRRFVKENSFSEKTNETLYWLGILATDGCISKDGRVSLSFKTEDEEHLTKFSGYLKSSLSICRSIHCKNGGLMSKVSFRNKKITETLNNYGITNNKSFTLKINTEITFDFLRGVIDGDGSIDSKRRRIRIVSASREFIEQLSKFLISNTINHKVYNFSPKKNLYEICIQQQETLLKLINNLYNNATVFLDRKQFSAYQLRNELMKRCQIRGTSMKNPEPSLEEIL